MSQTYTHHCAVTVAALPGSLRADVRIAGDVDSAAAPVLADAVRQLCECSPRSVFIDLAGVTLAGSALLDFLTQVHSRTARSSSLVVSHAHPATRSALVAAGLLDIVKLCDNRLG